MTDDILIAAMRVLPKNSLSRAMGRAARARLPRPLMRQVLTAYVRYFGVDISESRRSLDEFESVDDFFTRELRPEARPIADTPGAIVSPADGQVFSAGEISGKHIVQAKGKRYSLGHLFEETDLADRFAGGSQVTIYLHPRDYHRVHAPVAGSVTGYRYVPGMLFPVSKAAVDRVDSLFAINERLVTVLSSELGTVAVVMVGAYGVGHITVSYDTIATNRGGSEVVRTDYEDPKEVAAGAELGMFHFGSTVILLFEPGRVDVGNLIIGQKVKMGQAIASRAGARSRLRVIQGS